MPEYEPTKRIPKSLTNATTLLGPYTLEDIIVITAPAVIVVFLSKYVLPTGLRINGYTMEVLTLPVAALGMGLGALVVSLTPGYTSCSQWLGSMVGFYRKPRRFEHQRAKRFTQVKEIHPQEGAIERTDGAFVGMVAVESPVMTLASVEEWAEKASDFSEFLNTVVTFPVQIYSTTGEFALESYLDQFEARLADPDVEANPQLQAVITNFLDWYGPELERRGMTIRKHYLIVAVTPTEVQFESGSLLRRLSKLPVIGVFIRIVSDRTARDLKPTLTSELARRLERIETGLRGIDGCAPRIVPTAEAVGVIRSFWVSDVPRGPRAVASIRTLPVVSGRNR